VTEAECASAASLIIVLTISQFSLFNEPFIIFTELNESVYITYEFGCSLLQLMYLILLNALEMAVSSASRMPHRSSSLYDSSMLSVTRAQAKQPSFLDLLMVLEAVESL